MLCASSDSREEADNIYLFRLRADIRCIVVYIEPKLQKEYELSGCEEFPAKNVCSNSRSDR